MYIDADTSEIRLLYAPDLDPLFWRPTRAGINSAWTGHVPFAFWAVNAIKPSLLVELGTHNGVSYTAFCDAVLRSNLSTRCYAVDTWKGDPQAGEYGEDVFADFNRFHAAHYAGFSELLRCTFDEAIEYFPDAQIDLLHIDGYHTYEAVRADFERWKPKCSDHAVVLLHDTNVRSQNFGVWKLFAELSEQHPHFEFLHEHGLGVLAVGANPPSAVASLCGLADSKSIGAIRERFALLGERWKSELHVKTLETHSKTLEQHRKVLEKHILTLEQQVRAHDAQNQTWEQQVKVQEPHILTLEQQVKEQEQHILTLEQQAKERDVQIQAAQAAQTEVERLKATLIGERQIRSRSAARTASARKEAFEARLRLAPAGSTAPANTDRTQLPVWQAKLLEREAGISALHARLDEMWLDLARTRAERDAIEGSTIWRATWPLRTLGTRLPPGIRRAMRGGAKLAWWIVTLQLPRRLAARRRIVEDGWVEGRPDLLPAEAMPASPAPPSQIEEIPPPEVSSDHASRIRRVIYVSGEPDTPGALYRVDRYIAAARTLGLDALSFRLDEALLNLPTLTAADVVIVWRAAWDPMVEAIVQAARQVGALLIFDLDDLVVNPDLAQTSIIDGIRSQGIPEDHVRQHFRRFQDTMHAADLCTAATEALAQEMRQFHKTSFVLPNTFDDTVYRTSRFVARWKTMHHDDGLIRIGYAGGSRTHQRDFLLVVDAVADALRVRPHCRLVLFRDPGLGVPLVDVREFPALQATGDQIEWRDLVRLADLPSELARFDINLAPLEVGNRFCEAKSELKFFEAAIAGVCTIASPTEPFRAVIRHGRNGYLAGNPAQWAECLDRLLDDPALRGSMAREAHHDALAGFGPAAARRALASLLDQASSGERAARAFQLDVLAPSRIDGMAIEVPATSRVFASDRLGQSDVTVVIPLYNYASHVIEALESVRLQSLPNLDLVVVDDSSTDDSLNIAVDWAQGHSDRFNRLLVLQNERNAGLGPTRNAGFDAAETPYVLPLDADNRLLPGCCAALLRTLAGSGASFAYPAIRKFGDSTDVIGPSTYNAKRFVSEPYVDAMALIRKEAWAIVRGYADMRIGWEDYDFWCRLAEQSLWGIGVGDVLAEYRVHGQSMLATTTDPADNKLRLLRNFEQRHPWARVVDRPAPRPSAIATLPRRIRPDLQCLLPILRCPLTHQPLVVVDGCLQTQDGSTRWRIVQGVPVLFPGKDDPVIFPDTHLSNPLPEVAQQLIDETDGLVLNLSAGGTANCSPNVIEVEAAIFRNTALVADAHRLPFADDSFGAAIVMNAFEHYRKPRTVARELCRILCPGGKVLIRTAFLQPLHEKPWHFYNCTKYGLLEWFQEFKPVRVEVSDNFNPSYTISWLLSEAESALRRDVSTDAADAFLRAHVGRYVNFWRDEEARSDRLWKDFSRLQVETQEALAAGFEYLGEKPLRPEQAESAAD